MEIGCWRWKFARIESTRKKQVGNCDNTCHSHDSIPAWTINVIRSVFKLQSINQMHNYHVFCWSWLVWCLVPCVIKKCNDLPLGLSTKLIFGAKSLVHNFDNDFHDSIAKCLWTLGKFLVAFQNCQIINWNNNHFVAL